MKIFSYQDNYPELKEKMIHELEELIQIMEENGINYRDFSNSDPKILVKCLKSSNDWKKDIYSVDYFCNSLLGSDNEACNNKLIHIMNIFDKDYWSLYSHPDLYLQTMIDNDEKLNRIRYSLLRDECKKYNYPLSYLNELINEYFTQGGKFNYDFY